MKNTGLKIFHLSSSINGGAGIATQRIHELFLANGYNSELIVGSDSNKRNIIFQISIIIKNNIKYFIPKYLLKKRRMKRHNTYESAYCVYQRKEHIISGLHRKILRKIKKIDVLFIYWVSDFVNIHDIEYLKSKHNCKIVFVMLDHAHIAGGYHFLLNEYNDYLKKIGKKILKPDKILFNNQLNIKEKIINKIEPEIISFSKKDLNLAINSPFNFKKYWQTVLPIKNKFLYPSKSFKSSDMYIKTIFSCAYNLSDYRKGSDIFLSVLNLIDKMLKEGQQIRVICSKGANQNKIKLKNIFFEHFEYNEDPSIYVKNYHQADIFLFTSIADSAPQMPSEALFCGLPVVSFNIANIPEIITDENDGCIIDDFNSKEMAKKSYELLFDSKNINSTVNKLKRHNKIKQYHDENKTMNIFKEIISEKF